MPGAIVHLIVQQRLSEYLRGTRDGSGQLYADLLDAEPCSPFTGFGSIGPDYLFFSLKEYGTPLDEFANFIFDVYDAFQPLISFYEDNIEPVVDGIENAIAAIDQALFQGNFGQIKDTADILNAVALNAVAVVITRNVDLFYPFRPKIQQGLPENEWYWFDFLHYRRTGRFCSTMWNMASGDDELMRYVLGYASHIGTDVVGHPFVNAITGGPYRTHWHRHKLVENWIDAYARNHYPDSSRIFSCLNISPNDVYIPNGIAGSYYYRLTEFPNGSLPGPLADLIARAMQDTYHDISHPDFLSPSDIDSTYRFWLMWFKRITTIGDAQEPTPVPHPGSATAMLINDFKDGFPSPPDGGGSSNGGGLPTGGGFNIAGILGLIVRFVKWLIDVVSYTITWVITHAVEILTLPFTEALATVRWLIYQIQKGVWAIYDWLRFTLVLGGYLYPEPRDLSRVPWGQAFINTNSVHLTGGPHANRSTYPRLEERHNLGGPIDHHLYYPGVLPEMHQSEPAPGLFHNVNPESFISQSYAYDPAIEDLYYCIGPYGSDNRFTNFINSNTRNTAQFGSALPFCTRLIATHLEDLPNFNLDGDRGYAWKTWRALDPRNIESVNPVEVQYIDT